MSQATRGNHHEGRPQLHGSQAPARNPSKDERADSGQRQDRSDESSSDPTQESRSYSTIYQDPRWRPLRDLVFHRDLYTCQRCGVHANALDHSLHADHIVPLRKGGAPFELGNLQTLCRKCNLDKRKEDGPDDDEIRAASVFDYDPETGLHVDPQHPSNRPVEQRMTYL